VFKAVFFDVDGVLVDSLEPHLQVTRDLGAEYGLTVNVPSAQRFKAIVRHQSVSPMKRFFEVCGFPEPMADRATQYYRTEFAARYTPPVYAGVPEMLARLHGHGVPMGLATLNVLANVAISLKEMMNYFPQDCRYENGDARAATKADALIHGAAQMSLDPSEVLLVGDQISDWNSAKKAGTQFLGVTYGWDINEQDTEFPIVTSPAQVGQYILDGYSPRLPQLRRA
jgi:phosphoglycolate phosphatase